MTHQNHQTNGASLEDCHTNFYALTELYGIKWRKLVWGESNGNGGGGDVEGAAPLADPVISSYTRCLAGDILCVWRRVPTPPPPQDIYDMSVPPPPPPPPLSLRSAKELWIFWYGEEPDLSGMVAPELMASQGEQGSWESGLSYECRSLLFKALHNLIERCLLSRDFVRLGKWFVQPYDGDEEDVEKSPWHLSFSFAFFLHGESTVCASIDVRQHPPVRTLTAKRLARVARLAPLDSSEPHADAKVILAPFGLEASVTGREWSETDAATTRLLDAWRQLYPLEPGCGAIEVICGGVRMRYPSPYVLAASLEYDSRDGCLASATSAADIAERTMRALTNTQPHRAMDQVCSETPDIVKNESDFLDPTRKTLCTCAKCRRPRRPRPAPFHRRPHRPHRPHRAQPHETHASGVVCSPVSCGGGSPPQASSAPPSAGTQPVSPALTTAQHTATTHTNIAHTQSTTCVPTTMHTPAPTPDPLAPPTPAPPQRHYPQGGESPLGGGTMEACPSENLKRPALPPILPPAERRPDPLEDEACLRMLYDYTSVHAWLEHPVKRFKSESVCWRECMGTAENTDDLYAGHTHATESQLMIKQERPDVDEIKEYKNLFTSDGLCPTLKDLDQIFDNSDDATSGDETLQVQTPPDSNKSSDETRCSGNPGGRSVRPEELSKMFPTPPSMEAHAQPSPGFTMVDDNNTHTLQPLRHNQAGSPQPDPIEDWSYVFKPPTVSKYVGSSKYAPLTSLPSQLLPPVPLPSHAVYRPRDQRDRRRAHGDRPAQDDDPPRAPLPAPASRPAPAPRSPPATPPAPRACPVLLNVLLADTVLNLFRDHNFDSCTLCVCGAEPKAAGNIRGADAATYLPPAADDPRSVLDDDPDSPRTRPPPDEDPVRCSCGFSAVLNRRLAHDAGLFYEDEMEITGAAVDPALRSGGDGGALRDVAEAVLQQVCAPGGAASALCRAAAGELRKDETAERGPDLLEYLDGGDAAARALRAASVSRPPDKPRLHRWPFAGGRGPRSSRDVVRLMRRLRPLLQDAIQKRCCGARMWDGVSGPLTWRQFHRLAGRGNEDLCEPQPVPPVLVGHERDWLALSPYALRHWERLGLEPYSYARDVAYVVLAPSDAALARPLLTFFRELSAAYETCRLGRHAPLTRAAPDGLLRASPLASGTDPPADEWLPELPNGALGESIRAYSYKLRTKLVPQLAGFTLDHTVFESDNKSGLSHMERPAPSPMRPPSTPDHPPTPNSQSDQESESPVSNNNMNGSQSSSLGGTSLGGGTWETEERGAPLLVIYIVEPSGANTQPAATLHALMRLGTKLSHHLHQHKPLVKVISLEGVWATSGIGGGVWAGEMKALAFSVFSGARRLLTHTANGKSLTGFGTAANASLMLKAKDEKNRAPYKLYSPAYVLAPGRTLKDAESWAGAGSMSAGQDCAVLFLAYCLSHDQRWLLAAATDARGELLDTALIDIHVPARARRRQAPARRLGLAKLMDFTLGVMSQSAQPWRLVVGRVGRIGHGELKSWSSLLSRKNLARASAVLREICGSCTVLYPGGAPCILSACLVSTEPDSRLRLMADRFTPDERFSQVSIASHLHTPRDVTATHILVFPTSATTQSNQMPFEPPMANGEDGDMNFLGVDMGEEDMGEDNISDLFMGDMFNSMWAANSPRRNDDDVPSPQREQHHNPAYAHGDDSASEPAGTVLQQPLALGYLVSTAPLRGMPGWWWGSSGHLREECPAFLKTALHLHIGTHDDYSSLTTSHHQHPLDSSTTTDVLRHVLEGYNALSWLALDRSGRDRASCLPLHVQALMRLYHAAAALA